MDYIHGLDKTRWDAIKRLEDHSNFAAFDKMYNNVEYLKWKLNAPYLYDTCVATRLATPCRRILFLPIDLEFVKNKDNINLGVTIVMLFFLMLSLVHMVIRVILILYLFMKLDFHLMILKFHQTHLYPIICGVVVGHCQVHLLFEKFVV